MNLLITGHNGFLGKNLCLSSHGHEVYVAGRKQGRFTDKEFVYFDLGSSINIFDSLKEIDVVIHCAARAHIMADSSENPLAEYRKINTVGTLSLAKQAANAGVKRFIFISTIKVNGEQTNSGIPFRSSDNHSPQDPYAVSKSEAELGLLEIAGQSSMDVVIIRPPLIYGPGVKANFQSLMAITKKFIPLPFGAITRNKRSMVSIYNIIDLIHHCIDHPSAANKVFLVSDDDDCSTAELFFILKKEQKGRSIIFPVPVYVLNLIATLTGKRQIMNRLIGSLQVDIQSTKDELDWRPPFTFQESIEKTLSEKGK